jgi:iron(III) transport system ATP-binding protein
MTSIRLERLSKHFDQTVAVADADFAIAAGELFFLLGPSGCGKSTLLRMIAGLLAPGSGRILFNDRDVTRLTTDKRNAVMVFQSYALWPHMSVRENVRFGLSVRKLPTAGQEQRISEVLKLTRLEKLADRKPNELSGGQQQRVALARALAVRPDCLLLDEPLSNLDAKLRQEMRSEIRNICKTQGVTTVYVTHDQKEALSVADRIAVMNSGRVVQIGTPAELYHRPATSFVADFIGQSNLLRGNVIGREDGQISVQTPIGPVRAKADADVTGHVTLSIRPEQMRLADGQPGCAGLNRLEGEVVETTFLGEASEHVVIVNGQRIRVLSAPPVFDPPKRIAVEFDPKDAIVISE